MTDLGFDDCVRLAEHFKAIGQTKIFLHDMTGRKDRPWQFVTKVETGCGYRLGVPTGVTLEAEHPCGLTFDWSVDFEDFGASGTGTNKFDPNAVMGLAAKLPKAAQTQLARLLRDKYRPEISKRLDEIRGAMLTQHQSLTAVDETIVMIEGVA